MTDSQSMFESLQPLVVTPTPEQGESVLGFILRTAALNGYDNPNRMLRYAGMTDNETRSARPPLAKLAHLYNQSVDALKSSGLDYTEAGYHGRQIPVLGQSIHSMFTRCKHTGICVECVRERGYIEAYHELKYAVACPVHGVKTMYHCPACNQSLDWQRPGLAMCRCGTDLTHYTSAIVEHPVILTLLGVLRDKLMRVPLNEALLEEHGFPVKGLQGLSVNTLLSVIYRFGLFNETIASDNKEWDAVVTTAQILTNWPHGFHDYLEQVHAPRANLELSGLRGQFNTFYESFFKNIANENEVEFLREAFIQFGQQRWHQAMLHPLFKPAAGNEVVGMRQLAHQLGVQPSTLRKLITDGHVLVDTQVLNVTRKRLTLSPQQPFAFAAGQRLSLKQAAQRLDIPVDVLRAYRSQGLYQAKHLVVPIQLFHERDVDVLHQDLMQGLSPIDLQPEKHHITLEAIMRMKVTAEIKALWLAAVRDKNMQAIAAHTALPSGLVFDSSEVKAYITTLQATLQNTMPLSDVKNLLGINTANLYSMIQHGLLNPRYLQQHGLRITGDSLDQYQRTFIKCREIAQIKNVTQQSIKQLCLQMQIPLFQLGRQTSTQISHWIPRTHAGLLGENYAWNYCLAA